MSKIIPKNKYTPQKGDRIKGETSHPYLKRLVKFIFKHWIVSLLVLLIGFIYITGNIGEDVVSPAKTLKDEWDIKVHQEYNNLYEANFSRDYAKLLAKEEVELEKRLTVGKGVITEGYWRQAKEYYTPELKMIVETYPEITKGVVDIPEAKVEVFTAQNTYNDLESYLIGTRPGSPLIGMDILSICKEANITAWQCRLGLAILSHESAYGTTYKANYKTVKESYALGITYNNYGGVKCDTRLSQEGKPCKFPDSNGYYLTKFNSPESFLKYFFEQIIGKNWGVCKTTACMSPKYVAPMGERNHNWEKKINREILNLHFINY